jgi:hypothetical protein
MKIEIEVEEKGEVVRTVSGDALLSESLEAVLRRVAPELDVDVDELLANPAADDKICVRLHRVCIELHFETETVTEFFPAGGTWELVHRFGCRKFEVPHDACANLELHEGSPTGPALNDRVRIGAFQGCKTVWLVKPGPEPNG